MVIKLSYITQTHDLFIMTKEENSGFFIYHINLDDSNVMEQKEGFAEDKMF